MADGIPYGNPSLTAVRLNHAIIGFMGEVGELASALEHWIYYGQDRDDTNIIEELGDALWYIALACNALGLDLSNVMDRNIAKLKQRYPEKYSDVLAAEENRNRRAERKVLEQTGAGFAEPPEEIEVKHERVPFPEGK